MMDFIMTVNRMKLVVLCRGYVAQLLQWVHQIRLLFIRGLLPRANLRLCQAAIVIVNKMGNIFYMVFTEHAVLLVTTFVCLQ